MSYYGAGDYYGAGGLGGFLKGVVKAGVGFLSGGPVGAVTAVLPTRQPAQMPSGLVVPGKVPMIGSSGSSGTVTIDAATGLPRTKRRKMNYANSRALTRANRRVDGFVRLARRSLKHTGYKIVSKSAGRSKRPRTIIESGPGNVVL